MWPELIIVSTPILHLCPRFVTRHEPVRVQFGAELAVGAFDVAIVGRLSWPGEVEHDTVVIGPKVKAAGDEFAAVIVTQKMMNAWVRHVPLCVAQKR